MLIKHQVARTIQNRSSIENKQKEATIYMYGDIGGYYFDQEEWVRDFNALDAETIHLRVDSVGGDIFTARAMKTAIMQHKSRVIAHVDGVAASAASFLIMGADEIEIVDGGFLMVHNALSFIDIFGYFNEQALEELEADIAKERSLHGKINESIANDYMKRSGNSLETVLNWMGEETWFTAQEAVDNNLADRVYDGEPLENNYDLTGYRNVPEILMKQNQRLTKRALEKALRDVGLSSKEAKEILAKGFNDANLRDEASNIGELPVEQNHQRDADVDVQNNEDLELNQNDQRDAGSTDKKKDRTRSLLIRAEMLAPSQN